ncbi:P-loop NTPase [Microbacterium sp. W1N]|uniref:AAA family ATPase n=1 Tax=Microbacterium festucae TaxID=2977531 RepID=UPI0021C0FC47|nr:P-loop NTPase [Microbacterium festucae]MCT9818717.1 P-loop NTPase [Microbacterium festucae]
MKVLLAVTAGAGALAESLRDDGAEVELVAARAPAEAVADAVAGPLSAQVLAALSRADVLIIDATRDGLTADLVAVCDRFSVRIVARCIGASGHRLAEMFGVAAHDDTAPAADFLREPAAAATGPSERGRVIAVWGPAGAPGRTTVATGIAVELARRGHRVGLVDADSHAPSLALSLGIADEGPGFPAACRQAARGALTVAELQRIAVPLGPVEVLAGINRPARWPELSHERVVAALDVCRDWVQMTVVDLAGPLERDEEIVSDLEGPRRNAATLAALSAADLVVGVCAADPVGVSRFVRGHAELRAVIGATPLRVLVNKTRNGALGIDARGQVRRTLERFAGLSDISFAPWDQKATDAALLTAQPAGRAAGRSPLAAALRRFTEDAIDRSPAPRAAASGPRRTPQLARTA